MVAGSNHSRSPQWYVNTAYDFDPFVTSIAWNVFTYDKHMCKKQSLYIVNFLNFITDNFL